LDSRKRLAILSTLLIFVIASGPFLAAANPGFSAEPAALGGPAEMNIGVLEDEAVLASQPDQNFIGNDNGGGIWVGYEPIDGITRSWLKFDLGHIPKEIGTMSAVLNMYLNAEFGLDDLPIGAYYSANDTWTESTITWNLQPAFDSSPLDTIDSPSGQDMFIIGNWYSWDVTAAFNDALNTDKMLSLVMRQNDEGATTNTWNYFLDEDFSAEAPFNASYISVEYTTPDAVDLSVDGFTDPPLTDYVQDSTPTLGWGMSDSGIGEFQRDYEIEVWNTNTYDDTLLWNQNHTDTVAIHDTGTGTNSRPFGTAEPFRYQMKMSDSLFGRSGLVDKLTFGTAAATGTIVFENLQIFMLGVQNAVALTADFDANYDGVQPISVLNVPSYEAEIVDNWFTIDIENIYFLNGWYHQIIELRFTNNTGTLTGAPLTLAVGGTVAYSWGADADTSTTAGYLYDRLHNFVVHYETDLVYDPPTITANAFPFGADIGHPGIFQTKYNNSMIPDTGIIDKIWIPVGEFTTEVTYENLMIRLVETPKLGPLSHTDFDSNFAGATPVTVLDRSTYTVRNLGGVLVIDVDNTFYYNGDHDLLIDMRWDNLVSGYCTVFRVIGAGAYRAWNLTWGGPVEGNDTRTTHMYLDFTHSAGSVEYDGTPLVDATRYYWRVRTCDSTGIWSDWTNHEFKYEVLTSVPEFTTPVVNPDPAIVDQPVTVSLNVTYFLGVSEVLMEFDGSNHTMAVVGNTYSYTWAPDEVGNVTYTIYMESNIGTWSSVSGIFDVVQPGLDLGDMTIWIIAGVAGAIIVIVLVVIMRGRGKK
jgi:hypothetical protein